MQKHLNSSTNNVSHVFQIPKYKCQLLIHQGKCVLVHKTNTEDAHVLEIQKYKLKKYNVG